MKYEFPLEEMVFKGGMPYYPAGRVGGLLDIKFDDLNAVISENPQIVENSIDFRDNNTGVTELFLNPGGVYYFLIACEDKGLIGGKGITNSIRYIAGAFQRNKKRLAELFIKRAHPFVKAFFQWCRPFESMTGQEFDWSNKAVTGKEYDWFNLPVQ